MPPAAWLGQSQQVPAAVCDAARTGWKKHNDRNELDKIRDRQARRKKTRNNGHLYVGMVM